MLIDLNCPVEPRGYEIQINKRKQITYCVVDFFNLSQKNVASFEATLYCYDSFGNPTGEPPELRIMIQDENVHSRSNFKKTVPLPTQ